jgi:phosphoribosylaminoimidazole-succinocarboxamide synthase
MSTYKLIKRGKVKDIYEVNEDTLLFIFSDRVSAFDVILPSKIPRKGEVLCKFTEFWFSTLPMRNHMVSLHGKNGMFVKKLKMIPIECVVRGYLYGSYYERVKKGLVKFGSKPILASKLSKPVFDPTTKSEEKDVPITKEQAISMGLISEDDFEFLKEKSIELYNKMYKIANNAGFILADVKFEFGIDKYGEILLADSLGPDEFRLWLKDEYEVGKVQNSYDKQPVRDWLAQIGYKARLDEARKLCKKIPEPPALPEELIELVSKRYIEAYERISGRKLD